MTLKELRAEYLNKLNKQREMVLAFPDSRFHYLYDSELWQVNDSSSEKEIRILMEALEDSFLTELLTKRHNPSRPMPQSALNMILRTFPSQMENLKMRIDLARTEAANQKALEDSKRENDAFYLRTFGASAQKMRDSSIEETMHLMMLQHIRKELLALTAGYLDRHAHLNNSDEVSKAKCAEIAELKKILTSEDDAQKSLQQFKKVLDGKINNPIFNAHRTPALKRYINNCLLILLYVPGLLLLNNSYLHHRLLFFWQPESRQMLDYSRDTVNRALRG